MMHWKFVTAEKSPPGETPWLLPFVVGDEHEFSLLSSADDRLDWHQLKAAKTPIRRWLAYARTARTAVGSSNDGLITLFPQLGVCIGLQKRLKHSTAPCLTWSYNHGRLHGGIKRWLARFAAKGIDRFVVHSRWEMDRYSQWLGIPKERFTFVHYQSPVKAKPDRREQSVNPYMIALGSASRDYATLFKAVEGKNIRTIVLAGKLAIDGLAVPSNVEIVNDISLDESRELIKHARATLVLIADNEAASGHVSVVEAMSFACPVIATDCPRPQRLYAGQSDRVDCAHRRCRGASFEPRACLERRSPAKEARQERAPIRVAVLLGRSRRRNAYKNSR